MPFTILLVKFGSQKVKEILKTKRKFSYLSKKKKKKKEAKFCAKFFLSQFSVTLSFAQPNVGLFYAGNGKGRVYN
jgi:hypothetical protein